MGNLRIVRRETTKNGKPVHVEFVVYSGKKVKGTFSSATAAHKYVESIQEPPPSPGEPSTSGTTPAKPIEIYEIVVESVDGLRIVRRETTKNGKPVHVEFAVLDSSGKQINGTFGSFAAAREYAERAPQKSPPSSQGPSP